MQITIQIDTSADPGLTVERDVLSHDLPSDMTVENLKALVEAETGIKPSSQGLLYNRRTLEDDHQTLQECEVIDNSLLVIYLKMPASAQSRRPQNQARAMDRQNPSQQEAPSAETVRQAALGDPQMKAMLRNRYPELVDNINDRNRFQELYNQMQRQVDENKERLERLNRDPDNPENQREIWEIIRQNGVMENMEQAMENIPEVFGRVTMLYIPVEVNRHAVTAFVDSGAQTTIMSPDCAERCGIMHLLDTRFAGMARGVGTAKILGRVHVAPIKIGGQHFECSFTIMEGKDVDLLLGLDMLKRHRACIDLSQSALIIPNDENPVRVPFLGEADIPRLEETSGPGPQTEGADGRTIGGAPVAVPVPRPAQQGSGAVPAATQPAGQAASSAPSSSYGQLRSAHQQQPPSTTGPASFPTAVIEQVIELGGVSREQAIRALESSGGNPDLALSLLMNLD